MVGSINAPLTGNNTYAAFLAAAVALGGNAPNVSFGSCVAFRRARFNVPLGGLEHGRNDRRR